MCRSNLGMAPHRHMRGVPASEAQASCQHFCNCARADTQLFLPDANHHRHHRVHHYSFRAGRRDSEACAFFSSGESAIHLPCRVIKIAAAPKVGAKRVFLAGSAPDILALAAWPSFATQWRQAHAFDQGLFKSKLPKNFYNVHHGGGLTPGCRLRPQCPYLTSQQRALIPAY